MTAATEQRRLNAFLVATIVPSSGTDADQHVTWRVNLEIDGKSAPIALVLHSHDFGYCSLLCDHCTTLTTASMVAITRFMQQLERRRGGRRPRAGVAQGVAQE